LFEIHYTKNYTPTYQDIDLYAGLIDKNLNSEKLVQDLDLILRKPKNTNGTKNKELLDFITKHGLQYPLSNGYSSLPNAKRRKLSPNK
jgi:hypothetical protein